MNDSLAAVTVETIRIRSPGCRPVPAWVVNVFDPVPAVQVEVEVARYAEPVAPVAPTAPATPCTPVAPVTPAPVAPVAPVAPGAPIGPCGPVAPGEPGPSDQLAAIDAVAPLAKCVEMLSLSPLLYVTWSTLSAQLLAPVRDDAAERRDGLVLHDGDRERPAGVGRGEVELRGH